MPRAMAVVLGAVLVVGAVLLALFGLFAIAYEGDGGGGDTYVTWRDREIDADLAGAIALIVALVVIGLAVLLLRGPASRLGRRS